MRSRSVEYAKFNLDALYALNEAYADFVAKYMCVCCTIDLMQKGYARRGLLTSNPCEQLHSAWVRERDQPIMDFLTSTMTKVADYQCRRRKVIQECIDRNQMLVPKAVELHKAAIQVGNTLKVFFNVETDAILDADVCASLDARSPTFGVRIVVPGVNGQGRENCLTCDCKFMVFVFRPCFICGICLLYIIYVPTRLHFPFSLSTFISRVHYFAGGAPTSVLPCHCRYDGNEDAQLRPDGHGMVWEGMVCVAMG